MPAPRPRHLSQKMLIARTMSAPRPRNCGILVVSISGQPKKKPCDSKVFSDSKQNAGDRERDLIQFINFSNSDIGPARTAAAAVAGGGGGGLRRWQAAAAAGGGDGRVGYTGVPSKDPP
eukprot:gene10794-biopygen3320